MPIEKEVYLYTMIVFATISFIFFCLFFITKKNIWMKLRSFIAKKTGKVFVKYTDPEKGYYEDFCNIRENTVRLKPPGSYGKLIGVNPDHIFFDSTYYIRAISVNDAGSYLVTGIEHKDGSTDQKVDQQYITTEMADLMVRKALMSPKSESELMLWIKIAMIGIGVVAAIGLLNAYFGYNITTMLEEMPHLIKTTGIL